MAAGGKTQRNTPVTGRLRKSTTRKRTESIPRGGFRPLFVHISSAGGQCAETQNSLLACVDKHAMECYTKSMLLDNANKRG